MNRQKKYLQKTMDGNEACAYGAYAFTETAAIFPITPASPMAEKTEQWTTQGKENIFGQRVLLEQMQSEAGAAGAMHGALLAGSLSATYTASQGLLLMIPEMYKMAGELLPGVIHVAARTVASHALSIFGDHSDVMAVRQSGFALLASSSVQEALDLSCIAHLSAIKGSVPFLHFFDGFRTSHELQKIETIPYEELREMVDANALKSFREKALDPAHAFVRGTSQNPDIFFQQREAAQPYYDALPEIVEMYLEKLAQKTGRSYHLFDFYGSPQAKHVIVAMGSVCETAMEVVDRLRQAGEAVGILRVHLYRPFSIRHFLHALPETVEKIAVLDRTKETGAVGEPLYLDVCTALQEGGKRISVVGGRYGIGQKDTTPEQLAAVFANLKQENPKNHFTIGIRDDLNGSSLHPLPLPVGKETEQCFSAKFWGIGADGTVGANKNAIKIIGDHTDLYVQGYFSYDSRKSGGVTVSHLRFSSQPIGAAYDVVQADFIGCHKQEYLLEYDVVKDLKENGILLLNTSWDEKTLSERVPETVWACLRKKKAKLYCINGNQIAAQIGLGGRINTVLQGSFFQLSRLIDPQEAFKHLENAIRFSYGNKGETVVQMNITALKRGMEEVRPVDYTKFTGAKTEQKVSARESMVEKVIRPMEERKGDEIPVSAFVGWEDGRFPTGVTALEKRGVSSYVAKWEPQKCIACNRCAFVCPHACIRPFLLTEEEKEKAPADFETIPMKGKQLEGFSLRMQVSVLDCMGCGSCVAVCPAPGKALTLSPILKQKKEEEHWTFALTLPERKPLPLTNVRGSQFSMPLLEFSGACAGCGETPYAKLATQLFGERMFIANATGCSSIWGASAPAVAYTKNQMGKGPAWANSLFEDNAEFGFGLAMAQKVKRNTVLRLLEEIAQEQPSLRLGIETFLQADKIEGAEVKKAEECLLAALQEHQGQDHKIRKLLASWDDLREKSIWLFGGDGWAYDIGYGGLDHVLASGENVNILVFDTEVYSNTGGQASKATPKGAVAKFASAGRQKRKKDLGRIAMCYEDVYVAQVAMGADPEQCVKAFREAESYPGPSLILAYSPCINQGIKRGMGSSQEEMRRAVEAGYWVLYRYDPRRKAQGQNPFILDSKRPNGKFMDFLAGEVRYSSLTLNHPKEAENLLQQAEKEAMERYEFFAGLAEQ